MSGQVFFTSDLHLGHQKVAELRGFPDANTHDQAVLSRIASTVGKGDHLWILGDISAGSSGGVHHALKRLDRLTTRCYMHLVTGNHDPVHPMFRDAFKKQADWLNAFSSIQAFARRRINGHSVWLSHFPWHGAGDRGDEPERHPEVRLHDNGHDWLLHGHLHGATPYSGPRSFDVGLDAWGLKPVPLQLLEQMIPRKNQP